MFAIGREALTPDLKLDNAGVEVVPETLKISADNEKTNVSNIYAVGDVLHVRIGKLFSLCLKAVNPTKIFKFQLLYFLIK